MIRESRKNLVFGGAKRYLRARSPGCCTLLAADTRHTGLAAGALHPAGRALLGTEAADTGGPASTVLLCGTSEGEWHAGSSRVSWDKKVPVVINGFLHNSGICRLKLRNFFFGQLTSRLCWARAEGLMIGDGALGAGATAGHRAGV